MEENDLTTSPRKKMKLQHVMDDAMDGIATDADKAAVQADQTASQLDKEVRCGITEFVRPALPGFTGVLKKR